MQTHSAAATLARDILLDVVRFPLWWYTVGLARAARFAWAELRAAGRRLSIVILFRSLFKPMFGDTTKSGRAIAIVLRIITFAFRLVAMVGWSALVLLLVVLWCFAPVVFVVLAVRAFGG